MTEQATIVETFDVIKGQSTTLKSGSLVYSQKDGLLISDGSTLNASAGSVAPTSLPVVNVTAYGAIGDGSNDDSTAINAAIAALPASGGLVYHPAGNYKCNSPIILGDGTSSSLSTRNGIQLLGPAPVGNINSQSLANTGAARIFAGAAMSSLVQLKGPIFGSGISCLDIDGVNLCTQNVLRLAAAQWGRFTSIVVRNGSGVAHIGSVSTLNANTMHNVWDQLTVKFPSVSATNTMAYQATGNGTNGSTNTCYESFNNISVDWPSATGGKAFYGFYLQGVDNLWFRNVHMYGVSPSGGTNVGAVFDYGGGSNNWPADCLFDQIDWGGTGVSFISTGSQGGSVALNRIINISGTNGRPSNPSLTNLGWGLSNCSP